MQMSVSFVLVPTNGAQLVPSAPQAREKPVVRHQAMNDLSSPPFFEKKNYENVQNSSCHDLFFCSGTEQCLPFLIHGVVELDRPITITEKGKKAGAALSIFPFIL